MPYVSTARPRRGDWRNHRVVFPFGTSLTNIYSPPEPLTPISPQPSGGLHQNLGPSFGINHPSIIRAIGAAPSPSPWSLYAANSNKSPRGKKHLPPTPSAPLPFHCRGLFVPPPSTNRCCEKNSRRLHRRCHSLSIATVSSCRRPQRIAASRLSSII